MKTARKEPYTLADLQRPGDAVRGYMSSLLMKSVQNVLDASVGIRALEIGSGSGSWIPMIERKYSLPISFDHELEFLYAARKKSMGITTFACGDAYKLPFKDNSFDVVLFLEILEHLREPVPVLEEIKRIKKKEGILVLSTPHKYSLLEVTGTIGRLPVVRKLSRWIYPHYVSNPGHINLLSRAEAHAIFKATGYEIREEKISGVYLPVISELFEETALRIIKFLEPYFQKKPLSELLQSNVYVLQ